MLDMRAQIITSVEAVAISCSMKYMDVFSEKSMTKSRKI